MSETAKFVHRGTAMITPRVLKGVHKRLPFLKLKFTEFDDPAFPQLSDQLEFLADVVEDFAEGIEEDLPYITAAAATFALVMAGGQGEVVPDGMRDPGLADISSVVRTVLLEQEKVLSAYAERHKMSWEEVAVTL